MSLVGIIQAIQDTVGAVTGIRAAPDYPPENMNGVFPFSVCFPDTGTYDSGPGYGTYESLHNIRLQIHVGHADLGKSVAALIPYGDTICKALLDDPSINGSCETFDQVTYTFGPSSWGDPAIPTLAWDFSITNAKEIGSSSTDTWWLPFGVSSSSCQRAYAFKGAATQAASYLNLLSPGTSDAIPINSPTWDAVNGIKLADTSSQYLKIPMTIQSDWTFIIRFTNITTGTVGGRWICGTGNKINPPGNKFDTALSDILLTSITQFQWVSGACDTTRVTEGTLALAGNTAYVNGEVVGCSTNTTPGGTCISPFFCIGAIWDYDVPDGYLSLYCQAFAAWNVKLTPRQVEIVTANIGKL